MMSGRVREEGRKPIGEKKPAQGNGIAAPRGCATTLVCNPLLSNIWCFQVGPKVEVCEVGMGTNFGEDCFNCHRSL